MNGVDTAVTIMIAGVVALIVPHIYGKFSSGSGSSVPDLDMVIGDGGGVGGGPDLGELLDALAKPIMKVAISAVVLGAAIYIIAFKQDAETSVKDWAYGAVGTIVGFWLKI